MEEKHPEQLVTTDSLPSTIKEELSDESGKIHGMQPFQTSNIVTLDWFG